MPLLRVHHKTEYRYASPVTFGEHRIIVRPRDSHDLRLFFAELEITPKPMASRRSGHPPEMRDTNQRNAPMDIN